MVKKILVTGGAGYIGSHTCIELASNGYQLVVYDNLSNSSVESIKRVEKIINQPIEFIEGDILDKDLLKQTFATHNFDGVIHFAGLKAVGESVKKPLWYYQNNVIGTINLLDMMQEYQVKNLVFSSSATVYGDPDKLPIEETAKRSCTNPYGQSKLTVEHILQDIAKSDDTWNIISLRYFNPVGAHHSGMIGEDPNDIPNNLMPYISQVAVGKLDKLSIFGNDYDTIDGTGVRDYIHVVDLAKGHVSALEYIDNISQKNVMPNPKSNISSQTSENVHTSTLNEFDKDRSFFGKGISIGFQPINLGTGQGTSVIQLVEAFIKNTGQKVPYVFTDRRSGDIASCYASADRAKELLNWQASLTIADMCRDTWHWQSENPKGYDSE